MIKSLRHTIACTIIFLIALGVIPGLVAAREGEPLYDIVIRNGRELDGGGNPWIAADVAIKDGRFVRVGRVVGTGKREIDASGRYATPGWIDVM